MPTAAIKEDEIEVMEGADAPEGPEGLDMNFGFGDKAEEDESEEDESEEDESEEDESEEDESEEDESEEGKEGLEDPNAEEVVEDVQEEIEADKDEHKGKDKGAQPMIPKSRFDEVLKKSRELEARLRASEERKGDDGDDKDAPEKYDFDAKEREYQELVLDGEAESATKLRAEIRAAEREEFLAEARQATTETSSRTREQDALLDAARMFEEAVPQLKAGHENYDENLTKAVIELRDDFIASGRYTAVEALNKAVPLALHTAGITLEDAPAETPKPKMSIRRKKSVADKVKAAKAQPADLEGEGEATRENSEINLDTLTDEEFDALPPRTLARLRGDIV